MNKKIPHVGKVIRAYRKAKGYTLAGMGKIVGVTHQQYQRYENGETPPPFDRLEIIVDVLEIPPEKLFKNGRVSDFSEQFEKKVQRYGKILKLIENDPKLLKMITAYGKER